MEIVTILAAIKTALEIADKLMDPKEVAKYRAIYEKLEAAAPSLEKAEELLESILSRLAADASKRRLLAARAENPAFRKSPAPGIGGVAIVLAACLALSACCKHGAVRELPETEEYLPGYGVEWPEDASTNPADFATVKKDGRMLTTVPKK